MDLGSAHHYRIDWIASFVAVARHGSFSAAARTLYRSQPRVSSHVAALERLVGQRLVDRSVQPAILTPEGRGLLPHAEEIIRRLDLLAETAAGSVCGTVRLGCYPSVAAYLYPRAVRALRDTHPQVRLVLHEGPSLEIGEQVADGGVDLAVRPLHPLVNSDRVTSEVLWREPLVAVFRADHPLAREPEVTLAQAARLPVISIGESDDGHSRQYETNLAFANHGLHPVISERTNQPQTLISLVRHGLGVGITNALAMTTANTDGVCLVPLAGAGFERVVAVWWRLSEDESPAVEAVRDCLERLSPPAWPWPDAAAGGRTGTAGGRTRATGGTVGTAGGRPDAAPPSLPTAV
ncbi:LysR family transcriptional regulator [Actinomadura rubrisoli]|uniref:LysR family transcriptional regulator n=1 Tax=Actinomadura rubrisoli TaxID=2530368 RepID=A0A4R5BE37_9ACTN|nr:LysR family transcriptional regulator [Actinomadura rubrisoli]TDD83845.1 LysR family transcriptional regulator [Actinomadura rubrisoli]